MRFTVRTALLLTAVPLSALSLPTVLHAQAVTVQSVADVRLMGALGAVANMAAKLGGGSMHDIPTTMSVSGHRMRSDSPTSSSIIDADAGRITSIDHKNKTYSSMTLAEMAAAARQAIDSGKAQAAKDKAKDPNAANDSMSVKYKVAVDRTGQREKVAGYDAERVFVTITLEGDVTPEGKKTEAVGSMVFLIDEWISSSAPQIAAMREFQRAYAAKVGREFRAQVQGLQGAMAADPRMKDGFEAAAKELAKVPGIALRSNTYVALVPAGLAFDRSATLGDGATAAADAAKEKAEPTKEEKSGGGLRGMMGSLKSAAEAASKQADRQGDKRSSTPKQTTLLTVVDEVKSITRGDVAADMFLPPAGYKEVKR